MGLLTVFIMLMTGCYTVVSRPGLRESTLDKQYRVIERVKTVEKVPEEAVSEDINAEEDVNADDQGYYSEDRYDSGASSRIVNNYYPGTYINDPWWDRSWWYEPMFYYSPYRETWFGPYGYVYPRYYMGAYWDPWYWNWNVGFSWGYYGGPSYWYPYYGYNNDFYYDRYAGYYGGYGGGYNHHDYHDNNYTQGPKKIRQDRLSGFSVSSRSGSGSVTANTTGKKTAGNLDSVRSLKQRDYLRDSTGQVSVIRSSGQTVNAAAKDVSGVTSGRSSSSGTSSDVRKSRIYTWSPSRRQDPGSNDEKSVSVPENSTGQTSQSRSTSSTVSSPRGNKTRNTESSSTRSSSPSRESSSLSKPSSGSSSGSSSSQSSSSSSGSISSSRSSSSSSGGSQSGSSRSSGSSSSGSSRSSGSPSGSSSGRRR